MSTTEFQTFSGFPMPRSPESLGDRGLRPIVRTPVPGRARFPFPVPDGWFVVAEARDLDPGQTMALHVFGTDVVLFRTADGEPRMVDAYCAHLGAHLGVGGKVEGACIRCPFHGWSYDGVSGRCTDIPYGNTERIPTQAKVRSYPTIERNQMIWAWHHGNAEPPFYDVPEVPEFFDDDWLPYEIREFDVATCCQEMAENNVDFAHFMYVHGTDSIPDDELEIRGTYKRTVGGGGTFIREGYGLGLGVLHVGDSAVFISSTTPIDEENVKVRWIFSARRSMGDDAAVNLATGFSAGVSQDLPIWENKQYVARPVLTKSEKKLLEQREWALQFYSNYTPESPTS
jgi:phenylpropionate dioxygenase-like ring-hydroxylating dioxygenase large terminal subunit